MDIQPFYGKEPHPPVWTGLRTALGKRKSSKHNRLNHCVIFIVYTQFTYVAVGWISMTWMYQS